MAGLEVETIDEVRPEFTNVAVGRILTLSRHPNADKLVLCRVEVGSSPPLSIVCGASNITEGDTVPVALVGARLAGDLHVKKAKIRGETSEGMLCSERELGISNEHSGIMILPSGLATGTNLEDALGLVDCVLELGVTPNRPDCLSMLGVAREVAAITRTKLRIPQPELRESESEITSLTSVTIDDGRGCPRYAARLVSDVAIGPSPAWLQQRLQKAGLRPINNVVDVTNYVLIELGHPLHAFDYEKLEENRIVVRRAGAGESIVTLDGMTRDLSKQMLVIADAERPVAIAGVMGGANTEVTEQTRKVLIESAYFDPVSIRRTSKALGLSTEASYRFERGADPEMVIHALDQTAALMAQLAGGAVARGRIDQYPGRFVPPEIRLRHSRIKKILGVEIPRDDVVSILSSLGFAVISDEPAMAKIRVPSHRPDVSAEIDLIEEVARIHGYEKIEATYPQDAAIMTRGVQPRPREDEGRNALTSCGFSEIITFSFGSPADMADFANATPGNGIHPIRMKNPLAEDESVLRITHIPALLRTVQKNVNLGNKGLKVFEVGKVYWPVAGEPLPDERLCIAAAATGLFHEVNWRDKPAEADFFYMKGVAETLLDILGYSLMETRRASHAGFHPGICADILVDGVTIGKVGEIHPALIQKYDIGQKVSLFEIDLSAAEPQRRREHGYEKPSRFPYSERDLAIVVDDAVEAAALYSAIRTAGGEMLKRVVLFDMYRGKQVGEGKKSLAFNLRFQSSDRTLTDEEVTAAFNRVVEELEKRFGAKLRA